MIIILRGAPCTGKSTLADIIGGYTVSPDQVRRDLFGTCNIDPGAYGKEVFQKVHSELLWHIKHRAVCVYDATSLRLRDIRKVTEVCEKWSCPYQIITLEASEETVISRHETRRMYGGDGAVLPHERLQELVSREKRCRESVSEEYGYLHRVVDVNGENRIDALGALIRLEIDKLLYTYRHTDDMGGEVWVFGDLHGKRALLQKALAAIPDDARLVSVGDLIDRGEDSMGCLLDLMNDARFVHFTMGNHEFKFLEERIEGAECRSAARRNTHAEFEALPEETQEQIMSFLLRRSVPYSIWNDANGVMSFLVTHAGLSWFDPGRTHLGHTIGDRVAPVRELQDGQRNLMPPGGEPGGPYSRTRQIHGHASWNYDGSIDGAAINIDACAYETGILRLYNMNTGEIMEISE